MYQPWNNLTSAEKPEAPKSWEYPSFPLKYLWGARGTRLRGVRTQGRLGFPLFEVCDPGCVSRGNQDERRCWGFKEGWFCLAATQYSKAAAGTFHENKAKTTTTTKRDWSGGQRNCCCCPLILEIRSWLRSEDLRLGWDQLLKQIVSFSKCTTQKWTLVLFVFLSFLFFSFLLIVTDCYLPFSLLISTEHGANINIYFRQCFSVSCMLDRSSWCDLYAVIVRFKLFLSVRCLGWWISIFKKIPRCWQPQLTREDCAEGFGLACL